MPSERTSWTRARKLPVAPPDCHPAQRPLGGVVAHADPAVLEEPGQRLPVVEGVGDRLADLRLARDPRVLGTQPDLQLGTRGSAGSFRTARRSPAGWPLISRSILN